MEPEDDVFFISIFIWLVRKTGTRLVNITMSIEYVILVAMHGWQNRTTPRRGIELATDIAGDG